MKEEKDYTLTVVWSNGRTWSKDIYGSNIIEKANQLLKNLEDDTKYFAIGCNTASYIGLFDWGDRIIAHKYFEKPSRRFILELPKEDK